MRSNIKLDTAQRSLGLFTSLLPRITPTIGAGNTRAALAQLTLSGDVSLSVARNGLFIDGANSIPVLNSAATALRLYRAGVTHIELPQGISQDQIGDTFFELSTASLPKLEREFALAGVGLEVLGSQVRMPFTWGEYYSPTQGIISELLINASPLGRFRHSINNLTHLPRLYMEFRVLNSFLLGSHPRDVSRVASILGSIKPQMADSYLQSLSTEKVVALINYGLIPYSFDWNLLVKQDISLEAVATILSSRTPKTGREGPHIPAQYHLEETYEGDIYSQTVNCFSVLDKPGQFPKEVYADTDLQLAVEVIRAHMIDDQHRILLRMIQINDTLASLLLPQLIRDPKEIASFIQSLVQRSPVKGHTEKEMGLDMYGAEIMVNKWVVDSPAGYARDDVNRVIDILNHYDEEKRQQILALLNEELRNAIYSVLYEKGK